MFNDISLFSEVDRVSEIFRKSNVHLSLCFAWFLDKQQSPVKTLFVFADRRDFEKQFLDKFSTSIFVNYFYWEV